MTNGRTRELDLSYQKFNSDGSNDNSDYRWLIPLVIGSTQKPTPEDPHYRYLINDTRVLLTVPNVDPGTWLTVRKIFRSFDPDLNNELIYHKLVLYF